MSAIQMVCDRCGEHYVAGVVGARPWPPHVCYGAGPQERKLRNRVIFKLTGRWPESVVAERLSTPVPHAPWFEEFMRQQCEARVREGQRMRFGDDA
jgi:hypothetical protein